MTETQTAYLVDADKMLVVSESSSFVTSIRLPGEWFRTGWLAPADLDFETWESVGNGLRELNKAQHFWIGDWINAGEERWGEMYAQAMDETGFAYSTVSTDAWVCRRVPFCRRRQNLSFGHHAKVAPLRFTDEEQEYLLDRAEVNDWTIKQLGEEADKLCPAPPAPVIELFVEDDDEEVEPPTVSDVDNSKEPMEEQQSVIRPPEATGSWVECPDCGCRFPWRIGYNEYINGGSENE